MRRVLTVVGGITVVALLVWAFMPNGGRTDLQLSFSGLPPLANGFYYEGWAVVDGEPWTTGKFNVAADGSLVTPDGEPVRDGVYEAGIDMSDAAVVAITVHPPEDDRGPGAPHIVGGAVTGHRGELTIASPDGLGTDFADASGLYVLDGSNASLSFRLPGLHPGYSYQAWAVRDGQATSLGAFGGTPVMMPKEGEMTKHVHMTTDHTLHTHDVAVDGMDLRGATLLLTLEPIPDDSPEPFGITLLEGRVEASAEDGVQYPISRSADPLPSGQATIK